MDCSSSLFGRKIKGKLLSPYVVKRKHYTEDNQIKGVLSMHTLGHLKNMITSTKPLKILFYVFLTIHKQEISKIL